MNDSAFENQCKVLLEIGSLSDILLNFSRVQTIFYMNVCSFFDEKKYAGLSAYSARN